MSAEEMTSELGLPAFPAPALIASTPAPSAPVADDSGESETNATHWTARLLARDKGEADIGREARRLAVGLGLASIYGLAAGARQGGFGFVKSAALVPAALLAASVFGLPALNIALGMVDAPLAPRRLFAAAARATASAGLVLAGLAPLAALYVVSSDSRIGAAMAMAAGLLVGSLAGLRSLWRDVAAEVYASRETVKIVAIASLLCFAVFAAAVGCRVWSHLPLVMSGVN